MVLSGWPGREQGEPGSAGGLLSLIAAAGGNNPAEKLSINCEVPMN